jgi:hypothetical protein
MAQLAKEDEEWNIDWHTADLAEQKDISINTGGLKWPVRQGGIWGGGKAPRNPYGTIKKKRRELFF